MLDNSCAAQAALTQVSTSWESVADATGQSNSSWDSGGRAELQGWSQDMLKLSFGATVQDVSPSSVA